MSKHAHRLVLLVATALSTQNYSLKRGSSTTRRALSLVLDMNVNGRTSSFVDSTVRANPGSASSRDQ